MKPKTESVFFKILLVLLVLSMLIGAASCDTNITSGTDESSTSTEASGESSTTVDTGEAGIQDLTQHEIITDGKSNYTVVRAEDAGEAVMSAAQTLHTTIRSLLTDESSATYVTDWSVDFIKNGYHDPEQKEIIIGHTNYEESGKALEDVGYGDYIITTIGNKIVVNGWSDEAISAAVNLLSRQITSSVDADKNVILTSDSIKTSGTYNTYLNELPTFEGESAELKSTYDCGDYCYLVQINKAQLSEYNEYITKLENEGYTKYTENNMRDNLFNTHTKDKYIVNTMYFPTKSEVRITIETSDTTALPAREQDNQYTAVCEPLFMQVGVSPTDNSAQNGMSYILRLADGTFVVFDGGFISNEAGKTPKNNAKRIYEIVKEYAPDPTKLVISAWVITHGHNDHLGALRAFIPAYANAVDIKTFILNFPSDAQASLTTTGAGQANDIKSKIALYYKDSDVVKTHPGYVFHLADIKIEFFYSLELYAPNDLKYYNTSSLVGRVYVKDQTIMMTGDMSEDANSIICKLYGNYLKSDMVQIAHHGYAGGSTAFYRYVEATWAFWPNSTAEYEKVKSNARSEYIFTSKVIKEIYVAGYSTQIVSFPFTGENIVEKENVIY